MGRKLVFILCLCFMMSAQFGTAEKENKSKSIEEKFFDYVTGKGKSYKELKEYQEDYEYHLS